MTAGVTELKKVSGTLEASESCEKVEVPESSRHLFQKTVKPIAEQVADQLRSAIFGGEYAPETPLREDELASRFGVSRHPIRKVLQQLTLEGLLIAKPNCGVTVAADQTEHNSALLVPMRVQLELYALRQAGIDQLQAHRREWEAIVKRMERAAEDGDEQGLLSLDALFHQLLFKAARMEDFTPLWAAIFGRMRGYHLHGNRNWGDLGTVPYVHQQLLASFLSRDIEQAANDLQSHLERGDFNRRARAAWERRHKKDSRR